MQVRNVGVVALGGVIGSLLRWGLSVAIPDHGFPWATLLVNYLGSILLAYLLIYSTNHPSPRWWWRPALGSGFCGGFTTYSAFAVKIDDYLKASNYSAALIYAFASIAGSYLLIFLTSTFLNNRMSTR
ncbi:MAG: CrcB family protein [Actinomycetes bacterium]